VTPLERLRLAAALAHSVPAAALHLRTTGGDTVVVSAHPAADIDPCAMRRVVRAFAGADQPDHSARIVDVEFAGSLRAGEGGVFRVAHNGIEQRWVASLLAPQRLTELLDDVGLDRIPEHAMRGCLKPDGDLGVTLVVITASDLRYVDDLDEIAAQAAAAIFVEELRVSAAADAFDRLRDAS